MAAPQDSIYILIPTFNDWDAVRLLLPRIDRALADSNHRVSLLIVDDASTDPLPDEWAVQVSTGIAAIDVLHLRCNLGHQRAIALGLYHIHEFTDAAAVIVMDSDGEDRAEDLPRLLEEFENCSRREIIFAARARRMESLWFQFFYRLYQVVHRILTGIAVRVGNFSVVPRTALTRLVASPDLWNHYAAAAYRAKLPRRLVPLARGVRLAGISKMNFVSLLLHGLAAISVFSDQVSARLLAASAVFIVLSLGTILMGRGIPGWTNYTTGWLAGLMFQSLTFAVLFAFLIASRRSSARFILQRDAPYFILKTTTVCGRAQAKTNQ